ncbi:MAG: sulfonate/nitrate/taurine transporter substrate-binding protein, partial [Firmicutes bacterium]|nr:sulfonate/nitrate/taurine transporter substrate-binding protein [Bacillota bacterium]
MKRRLGVFCLILLLSVLALAGCQPQAPVEEAVTIRMGALTGPTAMGMAYLMEQDETGDTANDYDFTLAGSADVLTPLLIQGELDMAAIPANLAAVLYQRTEGALQVVAVNTLGVLYIVEMGDTVQSVADLAGKTIYATGKGSVPEYTLRSILESQGLNPDTDVDIQWKSEPAEVVAQLAQGGGVAMLPQPYVSAAQLQLGNSLRQALSLTEVWSSQTEDSQLITGVLVAQRSFLESHPEAVARFLEEYHASMDYVNNNIPEAAQLMEKFEITKASVAE